MRTVDSLIVVRSKRACIAQIIHRGVIMSSHVAEKRPSPAARVIAKQATGRLLLKMNKCSASRLGASALWFSSSSNNINNNNNNKNAKGI